MAPHFRDDCQYRHTLICLLLRHGSYVTTYKDAIQANVNICQIQALLLQTIFMFAFFQHHFKSVTLCKHCHSKLPLRIVSVKRQLFLYSNQTLPLCSLSSHVNVCHLWELLLTKYTRDLSKLLTYFEEIIYSIDMF